MNRTPDSLTVNDDDSLKSSESEESLRTKQDSGDESLRMNIQEHCIRRRPESCIMTHSAALGNHQLLFGHSVHVYIH